MSGIDSSHVVLIIAALAFLLTVALAVVTLGLTKMQLDAARSSKGNAAGPTVGGARAGHRSTKSKNLQRFSSRISVEDLMNENSAKNTNNGGALNLKPQAQEVPPAAASNAEDSESNADNKDNKTSDNTGPVRGSVFFLHESDVPSSSAVDCGGKGSQQTAAAAE